MTHACFYIGMHFLAAIELVKLLMMYDVRDSLLKGLVKLLRPSKEDMLRRPEILDDPNVPRMNAPLPVFVQQAAAAKCIGYVACIMLLCEVQRR